MIVVSCSENGGREREKKRTVMEKLVKTNMKWEGLPNNKRCIGRNKRREGRTSILPSHLRKNSLGYPGHEKNKSFEYPEVVKLLKRWDYSITLWSNSEISLSKEMRFWRVTLRKKGHFNYLEPIHFLHGIYLWDCAFKRLLLLIDQEIWQIAAACSDVNYVCAIPGKRME